MINSKWSLIVSQTSGSISKKIGEIFRKVFSLATQFLCLPDEEILKIFKSLFSPLNTYNLLQIKSWNIMYWDQIAIKNDTLQIFVVIWSYRYYSDIKLISPEIFLNCKTIIVALFGSTVRFLFMLALTNFDSKILHLAMIYQWQAEVLTLALKL